MVRAVDGILRRRRGDAAEHAPGPALGRPNSEGWRRRGRPVRDLALALGSRQAHCRWTNGDVAVRVHRWAVGDGVAGEAVPDRVPTATVPSARRVPDEGLIGTEAVPVGAVRRRLGDPLSTPSDEIADRHRMIVRLRTDSGRLSFGAAECHHQSRRTSFWSPPSYSGGNRLGWPVETRPGWSLRNRTTAVLASTVGTPASTRPLAPIVLSVGRHDFCRF